MDLLMGRWLSVMRYLVGLLAKVVVAILVASSILINSAILLWLVQMQPQGLNLEAIQAVCTPSGDCTIHLYEKLPEVQSVASGLSQELRKATIVIHEALK